MYYLYPLVSEMVCKNHFVSSKQHALPYTTVQPLVMAMNWELNYTGQKILAQASMILMGDARTNMLSVIANNCSPYKHCEKQMQAIGSNLLHYR